MKKITRALISLTDKSGIEGFTTELANLDIELLSTGGTAKKLREAGLTVMDVSEFTGFPEMLDGRVKTLHPRVHGGILNQRENEDHRRQCVEHGLEGMEERVALSKSLEGNITIEAKLDQEVLRISISDDGKGINTEKIKRAAIINRVISETEANRCSEKDILKLMFTRGFSTKKDSKGTFGRGVGLSAVGAAIEELGGDINVQTELRKGTTVEVGVPLYQAGELKKRISESNQIE